jgi:hypothetical protein
LKIEKTPMKFNESALIEEVRAYIEGTYNQHYSRENGVQAIDLIFARGRGEAFCLSNITKLSDRYGLKDGKNRKDLLKIIHYAILTMHLLDKEKTI